MNYDIEKIQEDIERIFPFAVSFRRDLHMYPELSGNEVRTSSQIASCLKLSGIPCEENISGHGVVGTIYGQDRSTAVAIRADIDALPVEEIAENPYRSKNPGIMHACGHDIHTAILIGTATILNDMKELLPASVRLIFQPSEETTGGAKQMIDAGCLENPSVHHVLGLHVDPSLHTGSIGLVPGVMSAASCEFFVTIIGKSCHGAHPDQGIDPLLPACNIITSLQTLLTRQINPIFPGLITVGQFSSGTKNNIIPETSSFSGIIRSFHQQEIQTIKKHLQHLIENLSSAYGARSQIEFRDSYPVLKNDEQLLSTVGSVAETFIGKECVLWNQPPSLGTDDFAYFCHHAKGLYFNLGTRSYDDEVVYPIHSGKFNPDEESIKTGILMEVLSVLHLLQQNT